MSTLLDLDRSGKLASISDSSTGPGKERGTIRVLCAQRDVIGKIGGGEAAAARLLGRAPGAHVTWPVSQLPTAKPDPNCEYATVDAAFQSALREQLRKLPRDLKTGACADFHEAISIAHAVRGREFDVVDCPDYLSYGRFLPFAFAEYGVRYKRLVCSLHGRLSRTFEIENEIHEVLPPAKLELLRRAEEQFMFGAADVRYGLSERYVTQIGSLAAVPVALVDPLCALPQVGPLSETNREPGHIWFVARQDRFKGADLFLAAIFRAGEKFWERYAICGPTVRMGNRSSAFEGISYCRHRGMPFNYRGPLAYPELVRQVYQTSGFVVVPSREETFNLVSLEALLNGTPVLVSRHAGAADFIRDRFGRGFAGAVEFDPLDELASGDAVRAMWNQLPEHRRAVRKALEEVDLTPRTDSLIEAYSSKTGYDAGLRDEAFRAWDQILRNLFVRHPFEGEEKPADEWSYLGAEASSVQTTPASDKAPLQLADALLRQRPADNRLVALHQARRLAALSPHANRARIYRYLAECEESSRPYVAGAYRLRAFRMGHMPEKETEVLGEQLHQLGSTEESACLRLWASSQKAGSSEQVTRYLEERRQRLLHVDLDPPEYTVVRRDPAEPKVSIIVSIYDAPVLVLTHFLAQLSRVAMVRNREAEVIFVDSGSPTSQHELLEATPGLEDISYALIRSVKRETIQTAWNRGLQLSRGKYITCLGVDEGVTESALDDLSRYLDEHPDIDWVTANTVVTSVDEKGRWRRDVMNYSRPSYSRFSYFNDCTYINYVGGLYRRSIHEHGWYDGTFKGAGDTEFKCRIFPFIRTAALPKTLGFYFDYPAARVTNSANIEVEDHRAWYVFRTPGGLEYLMGREGVPAWEELFWTALSGKRSWTKTAPDCDLAFAENVLTGLLKRAPSHPLRSLAKTLSALIREMRLLQDWSGRRVWLGSIAEKDLVERSGRFFEKCATLRPDLTFPADYRADALFFAHAWTW